MADFRINVRVDGNRAVAESRRVGQALERTATSADRLRSILARVVGLLSGAAATVFVAGSIRLARVQADAIAQVEARIAGLGDETTLTSQGLQAMARSLQQVTTVGDEAILRAQSILLTFRSLGRFGPETFQRITQVALDMAAAMGTDAAQAARQLGLALEDTAGITLLRRTGVTFTEEQIELNRTLRETGQVAEATNLILSAIEGQVGGTAQALRGPFTGALTAASNAFGDLRESIGAGSEGARVAVERLTEALSSPEAIRAAEAIGSAIALAIEAAANAIAFLIENFDELQPRIVAAGVIIAALTVKVTALTAALRVLGRVLLVGFIVEAVAFFVRGVSDIIAQFDRLSDIVENTAATWEDVALVSIDNFVNTIVGGIHALGRAMPNLMRLVVDPIIAAWEAAFDDGATSPIEAFITASRDAFNQLATEFDRDRQVRFVEIAEPENFERLRQGAAERELAREVEAEPAATPPALPQETLLPPSISGDILDDFEALRDRLEPVRAAMRDLREEQDLVRQAFDSGNITAGEAIRLHNRLTEAYQDQVDPLGAINREFDQQEQLSRVNAQQRETEAELIQIQQSLREDGVILSERELDNLRERITVSRNLERQLKIEGNLLNALIDPAEEYRRNLEALARVAEGGNLERVAELMRDLRIQFLETQDTLGAGFERGFLKLQQNAVTFADVAERAVERAASSMTDALTRFVTHGELSFSNLVNSILADLARLAIQTTITQPLFAALSTALFPAVAPGIPAGAPIASGSTGGILRETHFARFAEGGLITGPGTGTSDSIVASLQPGSFVVNSAATTRHRQILDVIANAPQYAAGGTIARISNGEYLIPPAQTRQFAPILHSINDGLPSFETGGVVPASAPASRGFTIQYIDQRSGDAPDQDVTGEYAGQGSDGREIIKIITRDTVRQQIRDGNFDGALGGRYGLRPSLI